MNLSNDDMRLVDWFRIMSDLKDAGYSVSMISAEVLIPEPTLKAYRRSSEPTYSRGARLINFWSSVMCKSINQAPKMETVLGTCTA